MLLGSCIPGYYGVHAPGGCGQSGWAAMPCCRLLVIELVSRNHPQECAVFLVLVYQLHVQLDAAVLPVWEEQERGIGIGYMCPSSRVWERP